MPRSVLNDVYRLFSLTLSYSVHSILQLCTLLQVQGIQHGLQQERVPGRPGELAGQPLQPEAQHRHRLLRGHLPQRSVPPKPNQTFYRLWSLDTSPFAREGRRSLYRGWEVSIVIRIARKNSEFRSTKRLRTATCHISPGYGHYPPTVGTYLPACTEGSVAEFMNVQFLWGFWAKSWEFSGLRFLYRFLKP